MKKCKLMKGLRHLIVLVLLATPLSVHAIGDRTEVVPGKEVIATQQDFENLLKKIRSGKPVDAVLLDNDYYIDKGIVAKAPLRLEGKNATIRFAYDQYSPSDAVEHKDGFYVCPVKSEIYPFSLFVDENDSVVEVSESVNPVTMVNKAPGKIDGKYEKIVGLKVKIPLAESCKHLKNKKFDGAYGYFDTGWSRAAFSISDSDGGYLNCTTLDRFHLDNINKDLEQYKKPVRYVIFNAEKKPGRIYYDKEFLYIPDTVSKVTVIRSRNYCGDPIMLRALSDINLRGISFADFCMVYIKSLLTAECSITGCTFTNCVDESIRIEREGDDDGARTVEVKDCSFLRCAVNSGYVIRMISSLKEGISFDFCNNTVSRYPEEKVVYKNGDGAVGVFGSAIIKNNTVFNTPRDHFYLSSGRISVSSNVVYNSDGFNASPDRNMSSDLGLIYCNHLYSNSHDAIANKVNKIKITDNVLYGGISYGTIGTGIYIDDGRGDVLCEGNIILNCGTSSIDSRSVDSFIGTASIRNVLKNNIMDNKYRLMAGKDVLESGLPVSDGNILLGDDEPVTRNVNQGHPDRRYDGLEYLMKDGKLYLNLDTSGQIRRGIGYNPSVIFLPARKFHAMSEK